MIAVAQRERAKDEEEEAEKMASTVSLESLAAASKTTTPQPLTLGEHVGVKNERTPAVRRGAPTSQKYQNDLSQVIIIICLHEIIV